MQLQYILLHNLIDWLFLAINESKSLSIWKQLFPWARQNTSFTAAASWSRKLKAGETQGRLGSIRWRHQMTSFLSWQGFSHYKLDWGFGYHHFTEGQISSLMWCSVTCEWCWVLDWVWGLCRSPVDTKGLPCTLTSLGVFLHFHSFKENHYSIDLIFETKGT